MLTTLAKNAVTERRFRDASYFYWLLSQLSLNLSKNPEDMKATFLSYSDKADVYYAYHEVFKYLVSSRDLCIFRLTLNLRTFQKVNSMRIIANIR